MLRRLTAAIVLTGLAALGFAAPAQAAPAVGTVAIQGDPGDYITEGGSYTYTAPDDRISLSGDASRVIVGIEAVNGDTWTIEAAAPLGETLQPGVTYEATRFAEFGVAGFDYSGNGRGCNTSASTFTVQTITTDASGAVTDFAATFEQHCDGQAPAARGQIDVSLAPPAPPLQLTVAITGATLDQYGQVIVTGTLTCSSDAMTSISSTVVQTVKRTTLAGSGSVYVDCWSGRTYTWDMPVNAGGTSGFQAGSIEVTTTATANDAYTGEQVQTTDIDTLRVRRPRA